MIIVDWETTPAGTRLSYVVWCESCDSEFARFKQVLDAVRADGQLRLDNELQHDDSHQEPDDEDGNDEVPGLAPRPSVSPPAPSDVFSRRPELPKSRMDIA